jgi:hypothetical protein
MRQINVRVIPHSEQRYETVGDWWFEGHCLEIRVSDTGNEDYNFLVARHEIDEAILCQKRGIKEENVSAFDEAFEAIRKDGNVDEPGNDPRAPYHFEHLYATFAEKSMCAELELDWRKYDEAVNSL